MKKFEYREDFNISQEELNEIGGKGWELVNSSYHPSDEHDNEYYYCFKREIPDKSS